jgi:hypothetical protein
MRRPLAWLGLVLPLAGVSCGSDGPFVPDDGRLDVLFIGNSLTYQNDLPGILKTLLLLGGRPEPHIESLATPNAGLEDHWVLDETHRAIAGRAWDVVILQQGPSATEGRPSLLEYSALFANEIRQAGGEPALYMVWPESDRPFDFDGVSESYRMAADEVDGLLFPVGEAWRAAWARDPSIQLYGPDGFHPSPAATYLAALVMFQGLTNISPGGLPAAIQSQDSAIRIDLPADEAVVLQAAAAEANAKFGRGIKALASQSGRHDAYRTWAVGLIRR